MACKYQEIYYPFISVFLQKEFSFEDYLHIEEKVLISLDYRIHVPFDLSYISIIKKFFGFNQKYVETMVRLLKIGLAGNFLRCYDIKKILLGNHPLFSISQTIII